jgi:hypothetical protein
VLTRNISEWEKWYDMRQDFFFVLSRYISGWGNQSLHENVFCLTNKQVGETRF